MEVGQVVVVLKEDQIQYQLKARVPVSDHHRLVADIIEMVYHLAQLLQAKLLRIKIKTALIVHPPQIQPTEIKYPPVSIIT